MSRPSVILPSVKLFYSYRREEKEDCLKRLQELVDKLKDSFQFQHQIDESIAPPGTYFRDEILQANEKVRHHLSAPYNLNYAQNEPPERWSRSVGDDRV